MATAFTQLGSGDFDRVSGLLTEWHRREGIALDPSMVAASIRHLLDDSSAGHAWLIELAGKAIGYVVLAFGDAGTTSEPRAYVSALYLIPEWRGHGFGAKALRFVNDVARWLHVRVLTFDVEQERKHAHLLYRGVPRHSSTFHQTQAVA